ILILELRVRVVHRMLMVLPSDFCELQRGGPVALHVVASGVAEHLRRRRRRREAAQVGHQLDVLVHRIDAVHVLGAERALLHLLEAERHHAVRDAALDELLGHEQRGRSGRAVVVDIVDWDAGHPESVERALAASRFSVTVADHRLLDVLVGDPGVLQSLGAGLLRHVGIVPSPRTRLLELGHADAYDVYLPSHFFLSLKAAPRSRYHLRGKDLNLRPPGYEPGELPDCSTPPRQCICRLVSRSTSNALECARACGSDAPGIEPAIASRTRFRSKT